MTQAEQDAALVENRASTVHDMSAGRFSHSTENWGGCHHEKCREARDLAERLRAGSTEAHVHRMTRGSSILGGCECGALYDETGWHEPVERCVSCDKPLPVACQDCMEYAVAATRAPREAYILRARLRECPNCRWTKERGIPPAPLPDPAEWMEERAAQSIRHERESGEIYARHEGAVIREAAAAWRKLTGKGERDGAR